MILSPLGIGAGELYTTLLIFLEKFTIKEAFPITNFLICINSFIGFIYGVKNKEQNPEHHFVDYDLVMIVSPILIAGTKIGLILNHFLPILPLLLIILVALVIYAFKLYNKYILLN